MSFISKTLGWFCIWSYVCIQHMDATYPEVSTIPTFPPVHPLRSIALEPFLRYNIPTCTTTTGARFATGLKDCTFVNGKFRVYLSDMVPTAEITATAIVTMDILKPADYIVYVYVNHQKIHLPTTLVIQETDVDKQWYVEPYFWDYELSSSQTMLHSWQIIDYLGFEMVPRSAYATAPSSGPTALMTVTPYVTSTPISLGTLSMITPSVDAPRPHACETMDTFLPNLGECDFQISHWDSPMAISLGDANGAPIVSNVAHKYRIYMLIDSRTELYPIPIPIDRFDASWSIAFPPPWLTVRANEFYGFVLVPKGTVGQLDVSNFDVYLKIADKNRLDRSFFVPASTAASTFHRGVFGSDEKGTCICDITPFLSVSSSLASVQVCQRREACPSFYKWNIACASQGTPIATCIQTGRILTTSTVQRVMPVSVQGVPNFNAPPPSSAYPYLCSCTPDEQVGNYKTTLCPYRWQCTTTGFSLNQDKSSSWTSRCQQENSYSPLCTDSGNARTPLADNFKSPMVAMTTEKIQGPFGQEYTTITISVVVFVTTQLAPLTAPLITMPSGIGSQMVVMLDYRTGSEIPLPFEACKRNGNQDAVFVTSQSLVCTSIPNGQAHILFADVTGTKFSSLTHMNPAHYKIKLSNYYRGPLGQQVGPDSLDYSVAVNRDGNWQYNNLDLDENQKGTFALIYAADDAYLYPIIQPKRHFFFGVYSQSDCVSFNQQECENQASTCAWIADEILCKSTSTIAPTLTPTPTSTPTPTPTTSPPTITKTPSSTNLPPTTDPCAVYSTNECIQHLGCMINKNYLCVTDDQYEVPPTTSAPSTSSPSGPSSSLLHLKTISMVTQDENPSFNCVGSSPDRYDAGLSKCTFPTELMYIVFRIYLGDENANPFITDSTHKPIDYVVRIYLNQQMTPIQELYKVEEDSTTNRWFIQFIPFYLLMSGDNIDYIGFELTSYFPSSPVLLGPSVKLYTIHTPAALPEVLPVFSRIAMLSTTDPTITHTCAQMDTLVPELTNCDFHVNAWNHPASFALANANGDRYSTAEMGPPTNYRVYMFVDSESMIVKGIGYTTDSESTNMYTL